jgi:hypothetical protein
LKGQERAKKKKPGQDLSMVRCETREDNRDLVLGVFFFSVRFFLFSGVVNEGGRELIMRRNGMTKQQGRGEMTAGTFTEGVRMTVDFLHIKRKASDETKSFSFNYTKRPHPPYFMGDHCFTADHIPSS